MKVDQGLFQIDGDELESRRGEIFFMCCGARQHPHDGDHHVVLVDLTVNEMEETLFVRDSSGDIKEVRPNPNHGCQWPQGGSRLCGYYVAAR